ncbi:hypothetical protein KMY65_28630, partial [Klebsiella pneumoniae]|nr:hypothetical protein [Klebsiella pneumoniae]
MEEGLEELRPSIPTYDTKYFSGRGYNHAESCAGFGNSLVDEKKPGAQAYFVHKSYIVMPRVRVLLHCGANVDETYASTPKKRVLKVTLESLHPRNQPPVSMRWLHCNDPQRHAGDGHRAQ